MINVKGEKGGDKRIRLEGDPKERDLKRLSAKLTKVMADAYLINASQCNRSHFQQTLLQYAGIVCKTESSENQELGRLFFCALFGTLL
jgi:hypothetical protein